MKGGREPLVIPDLNKHELTKDMAITKAFGGGCLIGAPIILKNGEKFGTLCGMDNKPFDFSQKDIELFKNLASLVTYTLELDRSHQLILTLSAPLVPVCEGVASLPLIGRIDKQRSEEITRVALQEGTRLQLEHLVVDFSGISEILEEETKFILNLVKVLKIIGVEVIVTGIRPSLARKTAFLRQELKDTIFSGTFEKGLSLLGINQANEVPLV